MAIGARKLDVIRLFVARGMALVTWGVATGLVAVVLRMPLINRALFGGGPLDPGTLIAAVLTLALAALTASVVPARRAAKADLKIALRYE
jgi:ABC-type antimicrobial peptide transport system permease subunit